MTKCPTADILAIISGMSESAAALNQRFGIPETVAISAGGGELTTIQITTPHCSGEMYLLGGQVTRWKPSGTEEVLWLSDRSNYVVGKAIRGGIPVCFPWFGAKADDAKAPSHGFVRTREWDLESVTTHDDAVVLCVCTRSDPSTRALWPSEFELRLTASFGEQLSLRLQLTNRGTEPLRAEEALHSYFTVGEIREVRVEGLNGTTYVDKTDGNRRKVQSGDIQINSETDRIYLNSKAGVNIVDPVLQRRISIEKGDSATSVIWNPWIDKAHSLADFGNDEWHKMLCIEPSNVGEHAIELAPGEQHTMAMTISATHV